MKTLVLVTLIATNTLVSFAAEKPDTKPATGSVLIEAKFIEVPAGKFPIDGPKEMQSGPLSAAQTQELMKKIAALQGAEVLSAPRVSTRDGQRALIQIGREVAVGSGDAKKTIFEGTSFEVVPEIQKAGIHLATKFSVTTRRADATEPLTEQSFELTTREAEMTIPAGQMVVLRDVNARQKDRELVVCLTASLVEAPKAGK
jgi:type II secretory pathway component GspD/PulD (secretin)